jgi:hypothetical protein
MRTTSLIKSVRCNLICQCNFTYILHPRGVNRHGQFCWLAYHATTWSVFSHPSFQQHLPLILRGVDSTCDG